MHQRGSRYQRVVSPNRLALPLERGGGPRLREAVGQDPNGLEKGGYDRLHPRPAFGLALKPELDLRGGVALNRPNTVG
jgi:hypothetical protein